MRGVGTGAVHFPQFSRVVPQRDMAACIVWFFVRASGDATRPALALRYAILGSTAVRALTPPAD